MSGYPLVVPAINLALLLVAQNKSNEELKFEGAYYIYLKMVSEKYNFKLHILDKSDDDDYRIFYTKNFERLKYNEINMLPITVYNLGDEIVNNTVTGKAFENFKLAITIPIAFTSNVNFPKDMLIYILCFPLIVLKFLLLVYLLDFDQEKWEIFYIFQILMGVPVVQPRKLIERIIFLTLVILSIHYSSALFANVADVKLVREKQTFNTINDILKSGMEIRTTFLSEDYEDEEIKQLFSKSKGINTDEECINMQIKRRDVLCILA